MHFLNEKVEFWLKFHWSLFLIGQLMISQCEKIFNLHDILTPASKSKHCNDILTPPSPPPPPHPTWTPTPHQPPTPPPLPTNPNPNLHPPPPHQKSTVKFYLILCLGDKYYEHHINGSSSSYNAFILTLSTSSPNGTGGQHDLSFILSC